MNPTIEEIKRELNKTFESVSEKWVKTSSILRKLNLDLIEQRQSKFSPESLIKLYLYRRIKGINYYEKVIEHLEKNESDAFDLGFSREDNNKLEFPTKRAFNKFFQNKIDDNLRLHLDNISKDILRIATQKGIVLDIELVNKAIKDKKDKKREKRKAFHEATKLVKKLVYPQIDSEILPAFAVSFLRPSLARPFAQSIAEQESKIVGTALHKPHFLRHPVDIMKMKKLYKTIGSHPPAKSRGLLAEGVKDSRNLIGFFNSNFISCLKI